MAKKLDLPRAWIAAERERYFGPATVVDWKAFETRLAEAERLHAELETRVLSALDNVKKIVDRLRGDLDAARDQS